MDKYAMIKKDFITTDANRIRFTKDSSYKITGMLGDTTGIYSNLTRFTYYIPNDYFYTPKEANMILRKKKIQRIKNIIHGKKY